MKWMNDRDQQWIIEYITDSTDKQCVDLHYWSKSANYYIFYILLKILLFHDLFALNTYNIITYISKFSKVMDKYLTLLRMRPEVVTLVQLIKGDFLLCGGLNTPPDWVPVLTHGHLQTWFANIAYALRSPIGYNYHTTTTTFQLFMCRKLELR